jgi:hypothetical protein
MTLLALALAALAACADDQGTAGPGDAMTRVLLTDAPFPFDLVQSVDVHIVSIEAAATFDTTVTVVWTPLATPDRRFNLLELQDGETALLGEADVVATDYAAIRMVIRTDLSGITLTDGSSATVNWMGPATQTIHTGIEQPFSLTDGPSQADLIIDFDVGRSFVVVQTVCDSLSGACEDARPAFQFLPWIRAVNEDATGTISGTVRGPMGDNEVLVPVPYANITVYRGVNSLVLAATGRADDEGRFRIHYVSGGGPYVVEALPPAGVPGGYGYARDVYVTPGETTNVDVGLGSGGGTGEGGGARLEIAGPNEVAIGQSIYLFAFVFNENGDSVFGTAVTWQQPDPGVARLDGSGSAIQLTGLAAGSTSVIATAGDLMDSIVVTVGGAAGAAVASVEVAPATATIAVGDSVGFQAVLRDSTGQVLGNRTVTWSVDASRLSVIGSFGHYLIVRATAAGATVITATSEGKTGTAAVAVQ